MNKKWGIWLSFYLFYSPPIEAFLSECIFPIVKTLEGKANILQYFFIRYYEKGYHIRLRVKVEKEKIPYVRSYINTKVYRYFADNPSKETHIKENKFNIIEEVPYHAEVSRYGGEKGISLAENHFQTSSQVVLLLLTSLFETNTFSYEKALEAALYFQMILLSLFDSTGANVSEVLNTYSTQNEPLLKILIENHTRDQATIFSSIQKNWRLIKTSNSFTDEWYYKYFKDTKKIINSLNKEETRGNLCLPISSILPSYIHMTNNRLGIYPEDELYLSYLLKESLKQIL